jgi:hypothetical protein
MGNHRLDATRCRCRLVWQHDRSRLWLRRLPRHNGRLGRGRPSQLDSALSPLLPGRGGRRRAPLHHRVFLPVARAAADLDDHGGWLGRRVSLSLAARAPSSRSATNHRFLQRRSMPRADAFAFPFLVNQPIAWRVAEFGADDAERFGRDEAGFAKKTGVFYGRQGTGRPGRSDLCAPKNFVCHPVADPGEAAL